MKIIIGLLLGFLILLALGGVISFQNAQKQVVVIGLPLITPTPTPPVGPDKNSTKPPIVDAFLCGDYCPAPKESYTYKVFEGVKDPQECVKLGGTPGSFIGWGETKYCLAPKLQVCPQIWSSNHMPCAGYCAPSESFTIDGGKFNENYVDVEWVQKNCSIKPNIVY